MTAEATRAGQALSTADAMSVVKPPSAAEGPSTAETSSAAESPLGRCLDFQADDLRGLGQAVAASYGGRMKAGLRRGRAYYTDLLPVTCSATRWQHLRERAREGATLCCPSAAAFFEGVDHCLDWDVYDILLDFEVFTLELQRRWREREYRAARVAARAAAKAAKPCATTASRGSNSSSGSGSSSGCDSDSSEALGSEIDATALFETDADAGEVDGDVVATAGAATDGVAAAVLDSIDDGAFNCDDTLSPWPSGRCTGFALVADRGAALSAQTVDLPGSLYGFGDFDCILRLRTPAGNVLVYDTDGRLCPIGLNSAGLGVTVYNLHQTQTSGFEQASVSVQALVWELLLAQHTLASATSWLGSMPLPPMCGSALVLVDATGALTVELSPDGVVIGALQRSAALVRANHPLHGACEATYGDDVKSRRSSAKRLEALRLELERGAADDEAAFFDLGGEGAMAALRSAKVRNTSTLAALACDVRSRQLHVHFRERQLVTAAQAAVVAVNADMRAVEVANALKSGLIFYDTGCERLVTGESEEHLARWASHVFDLGD